MEIRRFFVSQSDIRGNDITVSGEEFFHIVKVLRLKKGFKIIVCSGDGQDYYAEIRDIHGDSLLASVTDIRPNATALDFSLTLFQAIPSKDKLETIVQKAAELGVSRFVPFISERVNNVEIDLDRLKRVSKEAAKQCGANKLMEISKSLPFQEALNLAAGAGHCLMAYEREKNRHIFDYEDVFKSRDFSAALIIGSEGGFTENEAALAEALGIKPFTLGRRVLRCETAGVAAAAMLINEYDRANRRSRL